MGRILAIDYGLKRTGLAVTDPLKIIASALDTVETKQLNTFLKAYLAKEAVETIVLGMPKNLNNQDTDITQVVKQRKAELSKLFPDIKIVYEDERFTSSMAQSAILESGVNKKTRRDKSLVDKVSATIILQSYMMRMGI
ncbi:MAG TPA: Holliday junction resolvase RuvX [Cytophagales bacterium]|nr:Holliday junction resolvase RuvX [Cytophagales bacterium]